MCRDRVFGFPGSDYYVLIKSDVLGCFYSNIQSKCFKKEAGGQLFSRNINANPIVI